MSTSNRVLKTKGVQQDVPDELAEDVVDIVQRIISSMNVLGVVYFRDYNIQMCTVPQSMIHSLNFLLPKFCDNVFQTVKELNVRDEMIAFRIQCSDYEVMVAGGKEVCACVVQKKKHKKSKRAKRFLIH